jgi:uncharacterized repeat protein (TIGR03803 family)
MNSKTLFYLILFALVISLIPAAHAQTFSVIHTFTGFGDGSAPVAGVTIRGNALYGTTDGLNCGSVYQLTHSGSNWFFSTIAALQSHACNPLSRVVFGPDGHLYSTSEFGGAYVDGNVFKLTPPVGICKTAGCYWKVTDLHDFGSGADGQLPYYGDLIWDGQGNIYGTTLAGGTSSNCFGGGCGTVYEMTPSGSGYTESVLYSFSGGADGSYPFNSLVLDKQGNLFGTAREGGSENCDMGCGVIFELSYVVGVGWTEHVLYSFQNASDGEAPDGGLTFDSAGNLYGTTEVGGSGGAGTIFELSPSGNTWTFKLLYSFAGQPGSGPTASLTLDGTGNLYGTTNIGGIYNNGNVFKLSNTQNGWVYTSLHDFTGGADGGYGAFGGVTIDTDGTLYGTIAGGGNIDDYNCGSYGCGVVWMIKP